jgi:hypothetical protein
MIRTILREFDRTAATLVEIDFDEESWTVLRGSVIDLIHRGSRMLAVEGHNRHLAAIRWSQADAPVVLARAFAKVHRELTAAAAHARQPVLAAA